MSCNMPCVQVTYAGKDNIVFYDPTESVYDLAKRISDTFPEAKLIPFQFNIVYNGHEMTMDSSLEKYDLKYCTTLYVNKIVILDIRYAGRNDNVSAYPRGSVRDLAARISAKFPELKDSNFNIFYKAKRMNMDSSLENYDGLENTRLFVTKE